MLKINGQKLLFALCVVGVGFVHFIGSFMMQFIAGTTGGSTTKLIADALVFPLSIYQGPDDISPAIFWGGWALLSLLWGFAFCTMIRLVLEYGKARK